MLGMLASYVGPMSCLTGLQAHLATAIFCHVSFIFFFLVGELFIIHASVKHTCNDRNHKGNVQPIWRQAAGKFRQLVNNVTVFYVVIRCVRCA